MKRLSGKQKRKIMLLGVTESKPNIFNHKRPSNRHERRALAKLRKK
jgi:hypothetical protein